MTLLADAATQNGLAALLRLSKGCKPADLKRACNSLTSCPRAIEIVRANAADIISADGIEFEVDFAQRLENVAQRRPGFEGALVPQPATAGILEVTVLCARGLARVGDEAGRTKRPDA